MPQTETEPRKASEDISEVLDFKRVFDGMSTSYMIMDHELKIVYANPAYLAATQRTLDDIVGRYVFEAFPDTEDRLEEVGAEFKGALAGKTTYLKDQYFELDHADGTRQTHCWRAVQTPYLGQDGTVKFVVQHAEDITEQKALEARNRVISNELDHRVKNMFAIIQSIAQLTGSEADTVESYRESFSERLVAMGRTHSALSENDWQGIDLQGILEAELRPYRAEDGSRVTLNGPPLMLTRKSSQDASMITHELATNAAKYGCFSQPGGKLDIEWTVDPATQTLFIKWAESGLSGITPPTREGFGSLLTTMMPNLEIKRDYRPEGLVVEFSISSDIAIE
ncbi:MAG: HWE histidine kinase domain-containing protein [Pseudomonadota bacterium]